MENSIPVQIKQFSQPPAEPFDNSVSHSSGNGYKVTLVQSHPSSLDLKQPYKKRIIKQFLEKTTKNINPKRTFHPPSSAIILTMVTTISLLVQLNFAANLFLFMHFFKAFSTKNAKNSDFVQHFGCAAPKCWSRYTIDTFKKSYQGVVFPAVLYTASMMHHSINK